MNMKKPVVPVVKVPRVSSNNSKEYGLEKERIVKDNLVKEGALVAYRSRGSFGAFDVIGFYKDHVLLVSVKSTRDKNANFKSELTKLKNVKVPVYVKKQLRVWRSPSARKNKSVPGWEITNF